ncbi:unnamed protein product [Rotaria socialis]|uniref:Uncharacterized protein n=1 Tax=Rotaria socialis TaxID=392032 RepID=A0A818H317_9BILA|nr:unnamed protein product [Rotaria socialis]CAF3529639.1 unnamed protein product [Rotaria socialis]CAF3587419.1 unnamed protein product [Rotaria socialis]
MANNNRTMIPSSQLQITNSSFIKSEIERFESVHPSIYSIYEIIEDIKDQPNIQAQIRDHVMVIEDSFVNSQEWTLSRSVLDIRIGLLGTLSSGKSALVHRFLTGTYMQEESPEGGRFKKEIIIDNQSYLLLIRDEANAPDTQFTHWVDAVIFVFSLENEESFKAIYQYYTKMNHYRNITDMPFILVGTQDAISESNPRVIHEDRARKLSNELKRCTYYETCATYGLNVERVFHDACQKIVQHRYGISNTMLLTNRSLTPQTISNITNYPSHSLTQQQQSPVSNQVRLITNTHSVPSSYVAGNINLAQTAPASVFSSYHYQQEQQQQQQQQQSVFVLPSQNFPIAQLAQCFNSQAANGILKDRNNQQQQLQDKRNRSFKEPIGNSLSTLKEAQSLPIHEGQTNEQLTPTSTPTQKRKETKRKSNLFTPGKKDEDKNKTDRLGHGRAIPIKQGFLYKKGTNSINREWKKKYVVLLDDGRLIYHPSLHDYENDSHGKEIILQRTTIKIPGSNKPRIALRSASNDNKLNDLTSSDGAIIISNSSVTPGIIDQVVAASPLGKIETPNAKKRHRRLQQTNPVNFINNSGTPKGVSNNNGGDDDGDENVFIIVSLDKQWHFEAQSNEERDEWVQAIEQQILFSLQNIESSKAARAAKIGGPSMADSASIQTIKQIPGNGFCADCDQMNPTWASLNLGALICMDCASLHRNLGTHLSRVRSLELDEWPPELVQIMRSIGNKLANSIWEANLKNRVKPQPNALSTERERWIRDKYEQKLFLAPLTISPSLIRQSLIDAIHKIDLYTIILILAHRKLSNEEVNSSLLHLAASQGNVTVLQLLLWYGGDAFAVDNNGRTPLQCAHGDCIQILQTLTNNNVDLHMNSQQIKPISISPQHNTIPRQRPPASSPGPPYDKLPSTVI